MKYTEKKIISVSGAPLLSLTQLSAKQLAEPVSYPLYTILLIPNGKGSFQADFGNFPFEGPVIFFATPFQTIHFKEVPKGKIMMLQFHGDFYCIAYHKAEVACNGLLFNNIFLEPSITLVPEEAQSFDFLLGQLKAELHQEQPNEAVLTAYLQLFLAQSSRIKLKTSTTKVQPAREELMESFQSALEENFLQLRKPADYANLLHLNPNTFTKRCKKHFGKTPTTLIQERLVLEAKKQLHLTRKSIKEVAYALNFEDEYYFSRFFKKMTGVSPQIFREKTGISIVADLSI
ncbi:helix-turn-helix domain-containing protein [Pedobacter gandavensis]|uniref:helix-turn-helix domain-containing protein n=1 Tax=Pedobacter gandavensis TaxID=2679963 RepID=UPI002930F4DB|nr:helix-turn-helix domain-containing protein [Pedobacter gandavensis]